MVIPRTHGNIIDKTREAARTTREENGRCLAKLIESLQYLARQWIAFRGDDDLIYFRQKFFIKMHRLHGISACLVESSRDAMETMHLYKYLLSKVY